MAFSGGVFTRLYNWVTEQASSPIEIAKLDTQEEDFATGLSNCILRDGTGVPSANTPWNSKRITGLGAPTTTGDAADCVFGTFTGTLVGCTTSPTATCYYVKVGKIVVLTIYADGSFYGTSNSATLKITGLPAGIWPARNQWLAVPAGGFYDNSSGTVDEISAVVEADGEFHFYKDNVADSWTSTGLKGLLMSSSYGLTVTYQLT